MTGDKPLAGKRILVTRSRKQAGDFIQQIEELGGEAIPCPVIKTILPENHGDMDHSLIHLHEYDWIIFTSVNGVRFFLQRGLDLGIKVQEHLRGKVAAVGKQTAAALHKEQIQVEHIPGDYTADDLLKSIENEIVPGQRILIPQANIARKALSEGLRELGALVDDVVAYETVPDETCATEILDLVQQGKVDIITFTSSSTVRNFLKILEGLNWPKLLENVIVAVIGPVTAREAEKLGLHVDLIPGEYSIPGLLYEMVNAGVLEGPFKEE